MTSEVKPICKYGAKCFRKNKKHLDEYNHNKEEQQIGEIKEDFTDKIENIEAAIQNDKENVENRRESLEKNPPKKRRMSDEDLSRDIEKIDLTTVKGTHLFMLRNLKQKKKQLISLFL